MEKTRIEYFIWALENKETLEPYEKIELIGFLRSKLPDAFEEHQQLFKSLGLLNE